MVVLGPGSLFTSILPDIVIEEIGHKRFPRHQSRSGLCLQYHDHREAKQSIFSDSDHQVLHRHLGRKFVDTSLG